MASISRIPELSEMARDLAERFLNSGIQERESHYILRGHMILETLKRCHGNRRWAARELGTHRNQLDHWIAEIGIKASADGIVRACATQRVLALKPAARAEASESIQSFPASVPQDLRRAKA